jgi:hypothetical protein
MRVQQFVLGAANTDLLQGTILQTLEAGGQLDTFALTSVNDSGNTLSITPPGSESPAVATRIPFEARAVRVQDDTPFSIVLEQDGHVVINVAWASGTIQIVVVYRAPGEE